MRNKHDLEEADENWIWLDTKKTTKFRIDPNGIVEAAECEGRKAVWVACNNVEEKHPDGTYPVYWRDREQVSRR